MSPTEDRPFRAGGPAWSAGRGCATLVWIDADRAVIGRIDGPEADARVETIASDVPVHHRSTGHIRHDPTRHGGGGLGTDLVERTREEHLRQFIEVVADAIGSGPVEILGPGTCREHLTRRLVEQDVDHGVSRELRTVPSSPLTDRQFLARLRVLAGLTVPRGLPGGRRSPGTHPRAPGRPLTTGVTR